jgi:hypothetical protein
MPESYMIRGQQYVTEVIAVGDVKLVEKERRGRSVNVFWTSRNNKTGHAKIISEGDILNYKKSSRKKTLSFDPKTFQPGINYILVEMIERKQ